MFRMLKHPNQIKHTMPPTSYGPIAELRHATRSPVALAVGAAVGGAAPLTNYFTIHCGHLVRFDGNVHIDLWSPLWVLVAGSFALSSKSVFRWAANTFGDRWSAAGIVAMLEGNLILSPHPAMGICALVFLVLLNAAAYGSALALRDQVDLIREADEERRLSQEERPEPEQAPARAATPAAAPVRTLPSSTLPMRLPAQRSPEKDLYGRAMEIIRQSSSTSTKSLQLALRIRQPAAAALIAQLEKDGVVGEADPSDRGRRPVLMRTESA